MADNESNEIAKAQKGEIPKLSPIVQSEYFRKQNMSHVEWMDCNEYKLSELWNAMNTYISDSNRHMLDKCTYPIFCEFVARNTTMVPEYRDDC